MWPSKLRKSRTETRSQRLEIRDQPSPRAATCGDDRPDCFLISPRIIHMGQKTRPTGFRIGITEDWRSRWFAPKREYGDLLIEDHKIRSFVKKKYQFAGIPKIVI